MLFDFGQRPGGIIQTAFTVPDLASAMHDWTELYGIGPWFVIDSFRGDDPIYRGQPCEAEVRIGFAFSGSMMIELIQPKDDKPSVYKEAIDRTGYGFHHFGIGSPHFDASMKEYQDGGYAQAFSARAPTGDRLCYFDMQGKAPGFIEVIEVSDGCEAFFTAMYRAAIGWKGERPVRDAATGE